MIFASLETAIVALIVGIVLVFVANRIPIHTIVNYALYIIGAILVVLGLIALALFLTSAVL